MTSMEIKQARGKCIANTLVCQLCWTLLLFFFVSLYFLLCSVAVSVNASLWICKTLSFEAAEHLGGYKRVKYINDIDEGQAVSKINNEWSIEENESEWVYSSQCCVYMLPNGLDRTNKVQLLHSNYRWCWQCSETDDTAFEFCLVGFC